MLDLFGALVDLVVALIAGAIRLLIWVTAWVINRKDSKPTRSSDLSGDEPASTGRKAGVKPSFKSPA